MLHKFVLVVKKREKAKAPFFSPPPAQIYSALRAKKNADRRSHLFSTFSPNVL
jgi:hypothetical protein